MSEVYQCKYSFMVYYEINKVSIIIIIIIIITIIIIIIIIIIIFKN